MANPLAFDPERVLLNARRSSTEDLLNRVTVYRAEMEPEAVAIIERELRERGVTAAQITAYRAAHAEVILSASGAAIKCSFCEAPAVASSWGWQRLFGRIPVFPRFLYRCKNH